MVKAGRCLIRSFDVGESVEPELFRVALCLSDYSPKHYRLIIRIEYDFKLDFCVLQADVVGFHRFEVKFLYTL